MALRTPVFASKTPKMKCRPIAGGFSFWGLIFLVQMDRSQILHLDFGKKIQ
jgi:hypothetical protein